VWLLCLVVEDVVGGKLIERRGITKNRDPSFVELLQGYPKLQRITEPDRGISTRVHLEKSIVVICINIVVYNWRLRYARRVVGTVDSRSFEFGNVAILGTRFFGCLVDDYFPDLLLRHVSRKAYFI
jgi:hypothetical protein